MKQVKCPWCGELTELVAPKNKPLYSFLDADSGPQSILMTSKSLYECAECGALFWSFGNDKRTEE